MHNHRPVGRPSVLLHVCNNYRFGQLLTMLLISSYAVHDKHIPASQPLLMNTYLGTMIGRVTVDSVTSSHLYQMSITECRLFHSCFKPIKLNFYQYENCSRYTVQFYTFILIPSLHSFTALSILYVVTLVEMSTLLHVLKSLRCYTC